MNDHPSLDSMDAAYLGFFDNTRPTWCSPALKIEVMDGQKQVKRKHGQEEGLGCGLFSSGNVERDDFSQGQLCLLESL